MSERRYRVDYAGVWPGHCKSRESALQAAFRHLAADGYSHATVTDKHTGEDIARLTVSSDRKAVHVHTVTQLRRIGK